ncbi:unnamed protein product, partial [Acanthoscelides obtectus]
IILQLLLCYQYTVSGHYIFGYYLYIANQCEEEETLTKAASISGSFGDTEYESIAANIQIKISEANALGVGLQCDGWSNRRNESIINFIITTPTPIFFKTFTTDTNRHTAEYMAEKIRRGY